MSTLDGVNQMVCEITTDNIYARVQGIEPGTPRAYEVHWTDMVVNEWTEYYPDLATALLRFATLLHCTQSTGGNGGFTHGAVDFAIGAQHFLAMEIYG